MSNFPATLERRIIYEKLANVAVCKIVVQFTTTTFSGSISLRLPVLSKNSVLSGSRYHRPEIFTGNQFSNLLGEWDGKCLDD